MISTARPLNHPSSTRTDIYGDRQEVTFQYTAPLVLPRKPAGVRAKAPAAAVPPKQFDWFIAMLLVFLVLGIALVMGIFYTALYTPVMTL